jgi:hypothetical protein
MYMCARLAPCSGSTSFHSGYHGLDIIVRHLSEAGFEADARFDVTPGQIVRLKLPGAGAVIARITEAGESFLRGEFVNGLAASRLRLALGMGSASAFA